MQLLLSTKDIGFEVYEKTLFKAVSVSIASGDHIGFIGRNGSGKSTLLKVLAGIVRPGTGSVETFGTVQYVPQLDFSLFERSESIEAYLQSQGVSWALVRASLDRLFGATTITSEREIRSLSGGELAKFLIAIADTTNPDVLLLDEPTNHLDAEGLEVLKRYLLAFKGAFIVVSHDQLFLEHVATSIWELDNGTLIRFGGTYTEYQEQKRLAEAARERDLEAARKGVQKVHHAIEARETRVARATRTGRGVKAEPSRDKFAEAFLKGNAEITAGKHKRRQDRALAANQEKVQQLAQSKPKTAHVGLSIGIERSKRMLIQVSDASLFVADKNLLNGMDLRVEFGDRIALAGKNGSGKSSLIKALMGSTGPYRLTGAIKRASALSAVYLDQKYQTIDPERSALDNLLRMNPDLTESSARTQLGRYLFGGEVSVTKPAQTLSGGETARLALAQITSRPIDLLVLDEPTNNLDMETLTIMADALTDFPGALIVISHNVDFLSHLDITRAYILTDGRLKEMKTLPQDEEEFYHELTEEE